MQAAITLGQRLFSALDDAAAGQSQRIPSKKTFVNEIYYVSVNKIYKTVFEKLYFRNSNSKASVWIFLVYSNAF